MVDLGDNINCFEIVKLHTYEIHLSRSNTAEKRCEVVVNNDKVHFVLLIVGGVPNFHLTLAEGR